VIDRSLNVLYARNDGLCEASLAGRNPKGLPLLISTTATLLRFWRVRLEGRRILSPFNEEQFGSFSNSSVWNSEPHIHQRGGMPRQGTIFFGTIRTSFCD
jgi:hypothetical protein